MGFGSKKEESKSPLEAIVGSFTTNAEKINSFLGFPGVLLLFSIMLFTTTALPTTPEGGNLSTRRWCCYLFIWISSQLSNSMVFRIKNSAGTNKHYARVH